LRILSDLPDAFLKIVDIIHDKLALLDKVLYYSFHFLYNLFFVLISINKYNKQVFGPIALNGLCELLPKLNKYKNPPHVDKESLPRYSVFIF